MLLLGLLLPRNCLLLHMHRLDLALLLLCCGLARRLLLLLLLLHQVVLKQLLLVLRLRLLRLLRLRLRLLRLLLLSRERLLDGQALCLSRALHLRRRCPNGAPARGPGPAGWCTDNSLSCCGRSNETPPTPTRMAAPAAGMEADLREYYSDGDYDVGYAGDDVDGVRAACMSNSRCSPP